MLNNHKIGLFVVLIAIVVSLITTAVVLAQAGGTYDLGWWSIDGGGGASNGGAYSVMDTLGQSDASPPTSGDGQRYSLTDGFWQARSTGSRVYLPTIIGNGS
jgi:hypothetical protein